MKKAWIISVDMGYGHQRAAYPLKDIAYMGRIVTANSDSLVSKKEKKLWHKQQSFYEWVSRITAVPGFGKFVFGIFDRLQSIDEFYPRRNLSAPTIQVRLLEWLIKKKKLNQSLFEYVKRTNIPVIATHLTPALAAEYNGVKNIYAVVTDTDINRAWVPCNPKKTRITYLASCEHSAKRLRQYGVPESKIIMTGFPLPKENIGGKSMNVLKKDLANRLSNLDPERKYLTPYNKVLKQKLGRYYNPKPKSKLTGNHLLTLTFMTGGAGAQKDIGVRMLKSLCQKILSNKIKINLVAGTRIEVAEYYRKKIAELKLNKRLGKNLNILFAWNKMAYFKNFNYLLHTTDIIWTKPSEMAFYTALGLPIIIAPPIGAQEYSNMKWLTDIGSGFSQENPDYTSEWLYDWLSSGRLAEAAFEGFLEAPKLGTYNIERAVFSRSRSVKQNY